MRNHCSVLIRDLGDWYGFEGLKYLRYVVIRSSCEKALMKDMACR